LSTSGLVPMIDRLSVESDVSLAVSLHAPNDELRETLVPLNRKYPIAELMASCARYLRANRRRESVTFEYTLMKGINDQPEHARQLAKLMRQFDNAVQARDSGKVNLIPFNPFPGTRYERSDEATIRAFQKILLDSQVLTMVRRTRGDDIDAACGQLKGQVMDRTRRQAEFRRSLEREGQSRQAGGHAAACAGPGPSARRPAAGRLRPAGDGQIPEDPRHRARCAGLPARGRTGDQAPRRGARDDRPGDPAPDLGRPGRGRKAGAQGAAPGPGGGRRL